MKNFERMHDLVPDEAVLISSPRRATSSAWQPRPSAPRAQGGKGVTGHTTKEEDEVLTLIPARTLDTMLFFSDKGKVYSEKVYQIPDADRAAKGIPLVNVLSLDAGEIITAAVAVPNFETVEFITLATRNGRIKRMALSELAAVRPSGIIAIGLEAGDELGWARLTHGDNEIIFVTEQGQALRFAEDEVRSMGRAAGGVTGIRLAVKDRVTSMEVIEKDGDLLLLTTQGYGKRTPLTEYPVKGRATGGVQTIARAAADKIGTITAARVVQDVDDLTIITANGMVLRTKVKDVKQAGRATRGVHMMDVKEGDRVVSIARIATAELKKWAPTPTEKRPLNQASNSNCRSNNLEKKMVVTASAVDQVRKATEVATTLTISASLVTLMVRFIYSPQHESKLPAF